MKVLVTGAGGQLGYDVLKELNKRGYSAIGVTRKEMNLESTDDINKCIELVHPEAIIHCAAYTAVDLAEDNEELCRRINSLATRDIAIYAKKLDIPMIYISTDYVFDGTKEGDYTETDCTNPINIYGKTKYGGEQYIQQLLEKYYIVRTSWVFGSNGNNFIDTMLNIAKTKDEVSVISDQIGSPTYTKDLARTLVDMIENDKYGVYHITNEGFCSWYEFAKTIFEIAGVDIAVNPIKSFEYKRKARRPQNSKMSKRKLVENGFTNLRGWKDAVYEYINTVL